MGDLERIEAKVDWLVAAVKHLLTEGIEAEVTLDTDLADYLDDVQGHLSVPTMPMADEDGGEWIAPRFEPKPVGPPPCPHNQQVLTNGVLTCGRCSKPLIETGLVRSTLSAGGQVIPDPHPPRWATDHSPGASSKNPGTPLVPHSG
jgi:hypothetical protein